MKHKPEHDTGPERAAVGTDKAATPAVTDAVLTIPNLITFARLALIPVFLWLGLRTDNVAATWLVGFVAGSTDFIDGKLARRLGQVSKLGIAMDPLSDRILLGAGAWVFLAADPPFAPAWVLVVVVVRDAALLASLPFIARMGIERPAVNWFGKAGTMGVMGSLGFFMAAHFSQPPINALTVIGWLCYVPGIIFSYVAAAGYARDVVRAARSRA